MRTAFVYGMRADDGILRISPLLGIPRAELSFRATRAGGPGGQHVNRAATRIELLWDVRRSPSLTEDQRGLLLERLTRRLDSRGRLRVVAASRRSQTQNREDATERLVRIVATALKVAPKRRATRPTAASVERRLTAKKRRGAAKRERRRPTGEGETE